MWWASSGVAARSPLTLFFRPSPRSLAAELRTVTAEVQSLKSQKKNSELDAEVKGIEDVVAGLQKRIAICKKAASPSTSAKKNSLLGGKPKKVLPSDSKSLRVRRREKKGGEPLSRSNLTPLR